MRQRKKSEVPQDKESRNERFHEMIVSMWKDVQKGELNPNAPNVQHYAEIYQACVPKKVFIIPLLTSDHEPTRNECDEARQRISDYQKVNSMKADKKMILNEDVAVAYLRSISTSERWYEVILHTHTRLTDTPT